MTVTGQMKIGILGATLETPNLGVSTLATGAVGCIHFAFPNAQIFFLDYGREPSVQTVVPGPFYVQVPMANMRFSWRLWLPNHILTLLMAALAIKLAPRKLLPWLKARNRWLAEICEADLFAAVSGGDSFSDLYGWVRFLYVALPQILVILLGKRLLLLPQTYGPFRSRAAQRIARWIVTHAELSWCRDRSSLGQLMGVSASHPRWGESAFSYDLAFAMNPEPPQHIWMEGIALPWDSSNLPCGDSQLVGVNVSGLLFEAGYSRKNEFGLRADYRWLQYDIIHALLAQPETRVLLVPHVYTTESEGESDIAACEQIYKDLRERYPNRIGVLRDVYTPSEMRFIIGLCGFFVGSRMHACIAALAQNVPAVAIAYSDKFKGVIAALGFDTLVADARTLSRQQIVAAVENAWHARKKTAERLAGETPAIKNAAWNLLTLPEEKAPALPERLLA